ncbi:WD40 repeat-like protein [Lentinus brumalis]|uniref:WD40 repeat-like protein n=1 Tax=Lentinus brumalis TaxID=2498619 RepID=A0A371CML4_9APHY|nr:WD40 repeat-like protein [Polyporus brumalis]
MVYDSIEDSFDDIVPVIATMPSNKLRSLSIIFSDTQEWQTISDPVGHPLDDAILALGKPSVVVSVAQVKRNNPASKIVQRYLPRLHEAKLLQVQCSSGHPDGEFHLGHEVSVEAMDASPDGRYIATGADDGTVIVWSGTTAPERTLVEMQCPAEYQSVLSLHFSDTGDFLAGICDHSLLIWRVVDGVQVTSMPGPLGCERSCAWQTQSRDYLTLSVMEWGIHHDEEPRSAYLSVTEVHVLHSGTVTTSDPVSLSPDHFPDIYEGLFEDRTCITHSSSGSCVAVWSIGGPGCCIWKMPAGDSTPAYALTHRLSYGHPPSSPWWAIFVGDTQLVIGFDDGTIRWWDISSFPSTQVEPCGIRALLPQRSSPAWPPSISPQHSFLIAWWWEDKSVPILRRTKTPTSQGSLARFDDFSLHVTLHGHTKRVTAACFSPCERYVATASDDRTVRVWSTSDGELLWTFRDHDNRVTKVVFSPDGRILASAGNNGRVCIRLLAMFVRDLPVSSIDDT